MEFLTSVDTFGSDQAAKLIWDRIGQRFKDIDGICYYKHPIIPSTTVNPPDFTILARGFQPGVVRCVRHDIDDIDISDPDIWTINGQAVESPTLEVGDFLEAFRYRFDMQRQLRGRLKPVGIVAFPLVSGSGTGTKVESLNQVVTAAGLKCMWSDFDLSPLLQTTDEFTDADWRLAKSVFQGVKPLNPDASVVRKSSPTLGGAIKELDKEIALLDREQHKVAIQIAPGPQRIRGLAGTGKTVVLAMKAANIHLRYPTERILFTFNTQSLYNQAQKLITKFYRVYSDQDPNWDVLHVRHGWGSAGRPGVYSDLCKRLSLKPLTLQQARLQNSTMPFDACCEQVLGLNIEEFYDFILIDEAQDFPKSYFRLLAKLIDSKRRIYFAYDELQSLESIAVPSPEELFGNDVDGKPFVSLEGEYEGGIEKDFVLHRSYRCPLNILELAHGIGLGIHGPNGCVQMLEDKGSWESIGYKVTSGHLKKDELVEICRPPENSPNPIQKLYTGSQAIIKVEQFEDRDGELAWIASSIANDIQAENVKPEHIVVISLDSLSAKSYFIKLQAALRTKGIQSTIPGLIDVSWEFAEPGMVTLSTVRRAKGNESPVVYIMAFESLYSYAREVERRNHAFTSISRSKGWIRVTGIGNLMRQSEKEINRLLADMPCFRFIFPDMSQIGKLDPAESTRRKREVAEARRNVTALLDVNSAVFTDIDASTIEKLREKLGNPNGFD